MGASDASDNVMTTLGSVTELLIAGIGDPGVPNLERIVLRPTQNINLGAYLVLLGYETGLVSAVPAIDSSYWFGNADVEPPSWVVLYTGAGVNGQSLEPGSGELLHRFYWGKPYTVFHVGGLLPLVVRMDAVTLGKPAIPRPQQQSLPVPAWALPKPSGSP
jgi:hypothetical protein